MVKGLHVRTALAVAGVTGLVAACAANDGMIAPQSVSDVLASRGQTQDARGAFRFTPLASSAACTSGGDAENPLVLPVGFSQRALASEPQFADVPDMNTQNETGAQSGRYVYRAHEVGQNGSVSVTDLRTGETKTIAQRADWEALDPVRWTPWGTLLVAEETNSARFRDPAVPQAVGGLVYELFINRADPTKADSIVPRPAIGAKSHEGMQFDARGNLYSISERTPGYIFKFVPDRRGNLASGQTYVLRITQSDGDRTGAAEWVALDRAAVTVDASKAADAVGATGYARPEDVEVGPADSEDRDGERVLYVAITGEHRVLAIELQGGEDDERSARPAAHIADYVRAGVNVPASEFQMPDNLALDRENNLYITEDPGSAYSSGKRAGDDIWVASPSRGRASASSVVRFATLTDCDAEPTGIYFERRTGVLFVNVQHRGGDRLDKAMVVSRREDGR